MVPYELSKSCSSKATENEKKVKTTTKNKQNASKCSVTPHACSTVWNKFGDIKYSVVI